MLPLIKYIVTYSNVPLCYNNKNKDNSFIIALLAKLQHMHLAHNKHRNTN